MDIRKVQITGKSTFVVSLPKKWANSVRIKGGDSVIMTPLPDGTLLIDPRVGVRERGLFRKSLVVDDQDPEGLFRMFIGAYLSGYDLIEFRSTRSLDRETRASINRFTTRVIGPEVVEETSHTILVRDLLDASDLSLSKGVHRMHIIARNMHENAMAILGKYDADIAQEIISRDDEVDRLFWLISKQHNMILRDPSFTDRLGATPPEAKDYLMVARSIERIADHATKIVRSAYNVRHVDQLVMGIERTSTEVLELLDDAMRSFIHRKVDGAMDVLRRSRGIQPRLDALQEESFSMEEDTATIIALSSIIDSVSRTSSYTNDIAESAIDLRLAMISSDELADI
jgi:phosphate uptake regulator